MSATVLAFPSPAPLGANRFVENTGAIASDLRQINVLGAHNGANPIGLTATSLGGQPVIPIDATALAVKFADHFLPVVQASVDLLEADEADFEARCRQMLDADGAAMVDELYAEMAIVSRQMHVLADGLDLTRARLRTAMTRLAPEVETN